MRLAQFGLTLNFVKCAKFILHLLCDQTRTSLLIVAVRGHTLLAYTMNARSHYLKCQAGDSFFECPLSCVERLLFMGTHARARAYTQRHTPACTHHIHTPHSHTRARKHTQPHIHTQTLVSLGSRRTSCNSSECE